jgi:AraC-like DNA-binding protein
MDYRISAVIALMEKRLHQKTSVREMARSVQLSPSRLRHLFKAETAVTPMQYLKTLRMQEAKKIIGAACFSVKEVMIRVGLSDKSHFERDFKKAFGLTPAQYKALCTRSDLVKKEKIENGKHNGHQIANLAMQFVLRSSTRDSNLRAGHTLTGDGQAIVNHVNPSLLERSPLMDNENMIETAESNEFGELFEELSVTELEDRLELAARCVCRNEN